MPQGGRIGQAMRVFGLRSRLLPSAAVVGSRFPGLFPTGKAVLAVGRRPVGQDGEGQSTRPAHPAADPNPVVAFVVGLFPPPAMTGDRVLAAPRTPSWAGAPTEMQSPRIGLVFCRRQCDKENHGWSEGPPLTVVLAREFRSVEGLHPPEYSTRTKKEYCHLPLSANLCILAIGRYTAVYRPQSTA